MSVYLTKQWLPNEEMQRIACENNLAETAFIVQRDKHFDLRWMTPTVEVDLCGHATLASAHVIFEHLQYRGDAIHFQSRSGELIVGRNADRLVLDFPSRSVASCAMPEMFQRALGAAPKELLKGRDYFAVFDRAQDIAGLTPDFDLLSQLDAQGIIVTAPGSDCDFVSRYFAPQVGIPEDPATGSTHCVLSRIGRNGSANLVCTHGSFRNAAVNYSAKTVDGALASAATP